jgi:RimJ/RimL family protein N-acetyltransferase
MTKIHAAVDGLGNPIRLLLTGGDGECMRYTLQKAHTEAETWRIMAGMIGYWYLRGYGPYAVEEKVHGRVLGVVGLWYPHDWPELEIKWGLARRHWGHGFAWEAAKAVHDMALRDLPGSALISFINAANSASVHLAMSLGAVQEKRMEFRGEPWVVYRHCRQAIPFRGRDRGAGAASNLPGQKRIR